jgi:hypothetical protein
MQCACNFIGNGHAAARQRKHQSIRMASLATLKYIAQPDAGF